MSLLDQDPSSSLSSSSNDHLTNFGEPPSPISGQMLGETSASLISPGNSLLESYICPKENPDTSLANIRGNLAAALF